LAGINNIIGAYNMNPKRLSSKLSFEVGQVFAARIISSSELNNELILKLLDGWQFPAKLENPMNFMPEGLIKFQVNGFENGKLQLAVVKEKAGEQETDKSSLEDLLIKSNNDLSEEDLETLKKMIKHNMPLVKENITRVKTILDFKGKITESPLEEEKFIAKYLNSKNLDINCEKGKSIQDTLRGFFKELKNISPDEILTMLENNIELTEENIKSFLKFSKEDDVVFKGLNNLKNIFSMESSKVTNNQVIYEGLSEAGDSVFGNNINDQTDTGVLQEASRQIRTELNKQYSLSDLTGLIERELLKDDLTPEQTKFYKKAKELLGSGNREVDEQKVDGFSNEQLNEGNVEDSDAKGVEKLLKHMLKSEENEAKVSIKDDFKTKLEGIKTLVENIIQEGSGKSSEEYKNILQSVKEYVNDFKVFNSLSNEYYLIDVPINLNRDEYHCKLLIKDDRKSGKKIDSRNVSLVVSVKTTSIGVIDAYLKIRDSNMTIDLKCDNSWVKMLEYGKNKLLAELANSKYNVYINVKEREKEATLANCSEFFSDSNLSSINIRV
jgi:hypothetical protein